MMAQATKSRNKSKNSKMRDYLAGGGMTTMTLRIPNNLKNEGANQARLDGMGLSAYMRKCMIDAIAGEE